MGTSYFVPHLLLDGYLDCFHFLAVAKIQRQLGKKGYSSQQRI